MAKMTYVQAIDNAINFLNDNIKYGDDFGEVVEKLEALRTQLEKRHSSGSRKPTKKQEENVLVKQTILNILAEDGEMYTATEVGSLIGASSQKASALLRQLVEANLVERVTEGKKVYFKAV